MRRAVSLAALGVAVLAVGCGSSGRGTGHLVGLPASEAICRVAKEGLSYRMGSGPVVKPTPAIACRPADAPEPRILHVRQVRRVVALRATCDPTIGCA
jgi:hypothetical protein